MVVPNILSVFVWHMAKLYVIPMRLNYAHFLMFTSRNLQRQLLATDMTPPAMCKCLPHVPTYTKAGINIISAPSAYVTRMISQQAQSHPPHCTPIYKRFKPA